MKLLFVLLFFIQANFFPQSTTIDCDSLQSRCFSVEKMPVIIGGMGSLHLRLIYPPEALRLVNSSRYTAGEQRGKPVVITMSIPIVFKIDDDF